MTETETRIFAGWWNVSKDTAESIDCKNDKYDIDCITGFCENSNIIVFMKMLYEKKRLFFSEIKATHLPQIYHYFWQGYNSSLLRISLLLVSLVYKTWRAPSVCLLVMKHNKTPNAAFTLSHHRWNCYCSNFSYKPPKIQIRPTHTYINISCIHIYTHKHFCE